jgi:AcrR family transcriptional regulator
MSLDKYDRSCYFMRMSKGDATRALIVDRALAMAGEVGLEGVSLGALAADIQLSKSGLFAHFKSKEALQLAVLQRAVDHFAADVIQPALAQPPGEARVAALFERYLDWIRCRRGRCFFMALAQEYDDRPGVIRERLAQSQRDWHRLIARVAQAAVAEGRFRPSLDAEQFAYEFLGLAMAFQTGYKLLDDPHAEVKTRAAFDSLLARSRAA